ncbi:ABC transporter permease subunit [Bacillus sp. B4EP4a]
MRTVDADLIKGARSFGAKDQQTFLTVAFPVTIPVILTGCA